MNWLDGQKYCRENYTDLATIGSERENIDAATLVNTTNAVDHRHAWIGLHRNWTWSGMRNGEMSYTVIDVSIISPELREYVSGWRIRNGCPISDHSWDTFCFDSLGLYFCA